MDDLPRIDWPMERRIALGALLAISENEPGELAAGTTDDGVDTETARMRIMNNDWMKYDDHEEFVAEYNKHRGNDDRRR